MAVVPVDGSSPALNALIAAGGFVVAIIGGVIVKVRDGRKERSEPDAGKIIAVAGMLQDSRALENLVSQLGHNERAMRDSERATIDNTHEIQRASEMMGEVRRALETRNRVAEANDASITAAMAALGKLPGKGATE